MRASSVPFVPLALLALAIFGLWKTLQNDNRRHGGQD